MAKEYYITLFAWGIVLSHLLWVAFTVLFLLGAALGNLANGNGLDLLEKGLIAFEGIGNGLPLYASIFLCSNGKGFMCEPHGLHTDDCDVILPEGVYALQCFHSDHYIKMEESVQEVTWGNKITSYLF